MQMRWLFLKLWKVEENISKTIIIYFIGDFMLKAIKYVFKSIIIGVVSVLVFNLIGQFVNLSLPLNILSIVLIGFFRLPGFIVLLILLIL